MVVVAFAWALLAGLGVTAFQGERRGRGFALAVTGPVLLAGLLALAIGLAARWAPDEVGRRLFDSKPGRPIERILAPTGARLFATAGFAASALLLAAGGAWRRLSGAGAGAALLGLAILDLAYQHRSPNPVAPRGLYTYRPEVLDALGDLAAARVYVYDYSVPRRIERIFGPGRHPYTLARVPEGWDPGPALALGIQAYLAAEIPGRFALSQAYGTDLRGLQPSPLTRLTAALREVEGTPYHLRLLRAGGVTHTVSLHPLEDLGQGREVLGFFERPIVVQQVETPLPRVFAVGAARGASDDDALRLLLDPAFDLRREVVLAQGAERPGAADDPSRARPRRGAPGSSRNARTTWWSRRTSRRRATWSCSTPSIRAGARCERPGGPGAAGQPRVSRGGRARGPAPGRDDLPAAQPRGSAS